MSKVRRLWAKMTAEHAGVRLFVAGILFGVVGLFTQNIFNLNIPLVGDFYANLSTELLSIGITVLVIDGLNERRDIKKEKAALILQDGKP